jgi:hypothetical protein
LALYLESANQMAVRNWTHAMDARALFSLVGTYFNARSCVWEPLIEPCYDDKAQRRRYGSAQAIYPADIPPWTLRVEV